MLLIYIVNSDGSKTVRIIKGDILLRITLTCWRCGSGQYHLLMIFSARCRPNIYISRLCYDVRVRLSIRLSVTFVHCVYRVQ